MTGIERLHDIMTRLRDPETGCPWDRVQTLETLKPCVLEEAYELISAMSRPEDRDNHVEELGDVLLQVMFQCVMAEEKGEFSFDDVANAISDKLVRRHPHVFGDAVAKDPAAVLRNWEQIKQQEHRKELRHSALDGVPADLPALLKAQRTQEKAARVGFDWKDAKGPIAKIREELSELEAAIDASQDTSLDMAVKDELGDLAFAVANLARHLKADAESALDNATRKFSRRFRAVEAGAKAQGRSLKDMTLGEMDALWDEAKRSERKA
ncbi:MAG: nucleoside triphosphate pyrophosphohydrolase [Verrucomicrobiota bacterium]|nr:nucleoside triphosphate pyrophosphohydrolase [Verrucomicrobiota bacterium]